jgi:hypothetical protein
MNLDYRFSEKCERGFLQAGSLVDRRLGMLASWTSGQLEVREAGIQRDRLQVFGKSILRESGFRKT